MIRTQIQLTDGQMAALKEIAARQDTSVAELVRRGVERIIESEPKPSVAERRRRARAYFGRFRSGRGDLGLRHDDHLAAALQEELER